MASKPAPPPLVERTDIHKSCKSLETLLNVFNDYCEAAGAIVILQKKLGKALRETAGMKTTGDIAANAMNASATIFEVSSDIDSKFAKISDKEYDIISAEVKKWFKKLAKEEKVHDERMANANARIKQAGQVYEKKSKKNSRDATEEHARVADAEWLRTCEGVRRYSPTIGQLGEWRALCEGGWSGPIPPDLVDPDRSLQSYQDKAGESAMEKKSGSEGRLPTTFGNVQAKDSGQVTEHIHPFNTPLSGLDPKVPRDQLPTPHSPALSTNSHESSPVISHLTPSTPQDHDFSERTISLAPPASDSKETNMDSVRSLSAFPLPPTHFPIPPRRQQASQSQSSQSSTSYPSMPRLTESPLSNANADATDPLKFPLSSDNAPSSPVQHHLEKPPSPEVNTSVSAEDHHLRQPIPVKSLTSVPPFINYEEPMAPSQRSNVQDTVNTDQEFGVNVGYVSRSRAANTVLPAGLERTDTGGSSGSIVAAMRTRYSDNVCRLLVLSIFDLMFSLKASNITSPPPKITRRLSGNINDLASRYQAVDPPSTPRIRSPSASRQLPLPPSGSPRRDSDRPEDSSASGTTIPHTPSSPRQEESVRRRQQRLNDLAELELKENELALRERERDLQRNTRELDRERARLTNARESLQYNDLPRGAASPGPQAAYPQLKPRERKTSGRMQRPSSQLDSGNTVAMSGHSQRPQPQYSYSTSNLVPPSPSSDSVQHSHAHDRQRQSYSPTSYTSHYSHSPTSSSAQFPQSSQSQSQSPSASATHAPYCGCESCSATKYRTPQSQSPPDPTSFRPPAEPISLRPAEKKPGWMRRLSMPVGNAFSLDSKKSASGSQNFVNTGIGSGPGQGGRGGTFFSMDGKKNASSTLLNVREEGRRSYDASGITNRSMTNLGLGAGRR
ncbi:hypothetical protein C0991_010613 [Blastosporella zonata]|nr:hypothetical protein C0991_010613 [Blastosporella zonata]